MEMICKLLEVFLNKYFFNTVFSIFVTLLISIILPNSYWMIEKIGITSFRIFIFCAVFSFSYAVLKIYEMFREWRNKQEQIKIDNCSLLEKREKNIELLRNQADDLSYYERKVIVDFIKSGNAQRKCNDFVMNSYKLSKYLLNTKDEHGYYIFKMNDNAFKVFSSIYEKYGKLGHFDD